MRKFYSLIFFISIYISLKSQVVEKTINDNWFFCEHGTNSWLKAKIPGCQYTDLIANKLIPHPFNADNEIKLDSLSGKSWDYKCFFDVSDTILSNKNIFLKFEGLDTYCDIYLNGNYLSSSNNMFRIFEFPVKNHLKSDSNLLHLIFSSPILQDSLNSSKIPYLLPDTRAFTRKAPYQYGWDWGPKLLTAGIWKPVKIVAYDNFIINDVYFNQYCIEKNFAKVFLEIELTSECIDNIEIELSTNNFYPFKTNKKIKIRKGKNFLKLPFTIKKPKLWMPNGAGIPYLYDFNLTIKKRGKYIFKKNFEIGLRKIELIRENDSIGESFYFKINNFPVFIKGANYVPMHSFPTEVTEVDYNTLIERVAEANMNMLRVWGGGIYENDIFYDLCNKKGILVWQDFMFACNMYPGDSSFLNNVEREAIDNLKRLRNNACIAIWCGNNEIDEGWHNWGWQKQLN